MQGPVPPPAAPPTAGAGGTGLRSHAPGSTNPRIIRGGRRRFDSTPGIGTRLAGACRDHRRALRPLPDGDMLGFSPPLIATEADVEETIARMKRALDREADALVAEDACRPA